MTYYQVIRNMANAFDLRLRMVKMAQAKGISATARYYRTTRKTVEKWVRRYRQGGLKALEDRKRAPKRIPHKMPKELEKRIVELRKRYPGWGPKRLKTYFNLPCCEGAIHRVLKQNGLIRKRKKKWKKRRDLRKLKAALKPFEELILDGKDLKDIEHYWPQMRFKGLPSYQYTARDVRTGATYFAYCDTNDSTSATIFLRYVLEHLARCGVDLATLTVQTDNGADLVGSPNQKPSRTSTFEVMARFLGVRHVRIPPRRPTWNSEVESFHGALSRHEDEFYHVEDFANHRTFFDKSTTYQLFYNTERKNRWRDNKTPLDLIEELAPSIDSQRVVNLRPVALGSLIDHGYHLPASPNPSAQRH